MTELPNKIENKDNKSVIMENTVLNKSVRQNALRAQESQNVLGILLKTILKFRNSHFYKNLYSKNCRILIFFQCCVHVYMEDIASDTLFDTVSQKWKNK